VIDIPGVLEALVRQRADFIIVGGVAATMHGSARVTQDLDVVYARNETNLHRVVAALRRHHPYPRGAPRGLPFSWDARTLEGGLNFTMSTDLGDIDLLGEITGGGRYEQLLPHSLEVDIFGLCCRCLDLETLIRVKRAAGRPRDIEAIAELQVILEERDSARD
jgi:hypothetical protein